MPAHQLADYNTHACNFVRELLRHCANMRKLAKETGLHVQTTLLSNSMCRMSSGNTECLGPPPSPARAHQCISEADAVG